MPRPRHNCNAKLTGSRIYGFPLWGKLSPQATDEGELSGHFPLIRRVPRHLPPKGEGFPPHLNSKLSTLNFPPLSYFHQKNARGVV